jgi:hypothetical protein
VAAVPALELVLHHHGDLAVLAADQLLHAAGQHRVGPVGLGLELQALVVSEQERTS